jgi:hypothetical protein
LKSGQGDRLSSTISVMNDQTAISPDPIDLIDGLLDCTNDPLRFVELAFPHIRLENWQRQVMAHISHRLSTNAQLSKFDPIQIAVASGNTVGKTALLSWLILWALITFEDTLGVVTAGTEPQIRTRLWGELSKWFHQLPEELRAAFELTATAIFNRQHERTWRIDGRPWSERNQEAFSGLHNYGKRVLVLMDECSMIPESIWKACDGMLTDASTQIVYCVFGNPLRIDGRFPQCFPGGRFAGMWKAIRVDSRTVSLSNKESLDEKINYYGPDSNYVRSHILGQFPTASTSQLIPLDVVEMAAIRNVSALPSDATVLGVDVASGHGEDSSVIYIRRGHDGRAHPPRKYPNVDPAQLAYKVVAAANEFRPDAIFIDATGMGEGTVARVRELGWAAHAVYFGSKADNSGGRWRCANKRSECWVSMYDWLRVGAIPNDEELKAQLVGPEYSQNAQGIILERKEDMRSRGLASPDISDALALTFAVPVLAATSFAGRGDQNVISEYDPYSREAMGMDGEAYYPEARAHGRRFYAEGWARLKPEYE